MSETQVIHKTIDIEGVFARKNPALARIIPGFVLRYLKRIIHEDEINIHLEKYKNARGLDFVSDTIDFFKVNIQEKGAERIPPEAPAIIASNHPLGGLDGLALMHAVASVRRDIVFPVNDILLFLPPLRELFIPVNKHGSNQENIQIIHDTFNSGKIILYFPAGLVSRKRNGIIRDLEWKKTFITKARQYKRDVIPVHISGRNRNFFYNLANLRKKLGIKTNIEMLYLPDEMYRQNNKTIFIIFGRPIPCTVFDKRYSDKAWAQKLRNFVYELEKNPDLEFDPEKF